MARRPRSLRIHPLRRLTLARALALNDRGAGKRVAGFRRTARLAIVTGGTWGRRSRKPRLGAHANRRWLLPCRLSFATSTPPHIAFARAPSYGSLTRSGSVTASGSAGASVSDSVCTSTRTEEGGSRWAAQRLGGRLDIRSRRETAERAPIASTPVASRPPVAHHATRMLALALLRSF